MQREQFCPHCGSRFSAIITQGSQPPFCGRCRMPIHANPLPATCTVVTDNRQRVLLLKEDETDTGQWRLPGGFIQPSESPEHSALRTLKETTGLTGQIEVLLGVETDTGKAGDPLMVIGYRVIRTSGDPTPGNGALQFAWFHPAKLPSIAFRSHRHFIRIVYAVQDN